jgi:hypothetical protein
MIHQELGDVMTRAATVVRENKQLEEAIGKVHELHERVKRCSLSDTGSWTNQNVVFTKAVQDMFPIAFAVLQGALQRDECRGAHFKPAFAPPSLTPQNQPNVFAKPKNGAIDSKRTTNASSSLRSLLGMETRSRSITKMSTLRSSHHALDCTGWLVQNKLKKFGVNAAKPAESKTSVPHWLPRAPKFFQPIGGHL